MYEEPTDTFEEGMMIEEEPYYEGEEMTGLTVGDNALIVVDAKEGVEAGTERAWKEAAGKRTPYH